MAEVRATCLVSPLHSKYYKFWAYLSEDLAAAAEIIPEVTGSIIFGQAAYSVFKSKISGGCRPGF